MGEDIIDDSVRALPIDVALKNAGSTRDRYFRAPSILGTDEDEGRCIAWNGPASTSPPPRASPPALPRGSSAQPEVAKASLDAIEWT